MLLDAEVCVWVGDNDVVEHDYVSIIPRRTYILRLLEELCFEIRLRMELDL